MKNIIKSLYEDAKNIKEKDPACRNILEVIIGWFQVQKY